MTHEEAVGFLQASGWLQDHDKQIYEQGKMDGIEWHPYPKEKPEGENGYYLVTALRGGEHQVCTAWWVDETYCFGIFTDRVTAWAELPKPYEEGADDGQHQL